MKTPSKPSNFRERGVELLRISNDKMVCAARDLAEFTKNGINAGFIVSLAHKCEDLAQTLDHHPHKVSAPAERQIAADIWRSVNELCELGRKIFQHHPAKYNDYVIPVVGESHPDSATSKVA